MGRLTTWMSNPWVTKVPDLVWHQILAVVSSIVHDEEHVLRRAQRMLLILREIISF